MPEFYSLEGSNCSEICELLNSNAKCTHGDKKLYIAAKHTYMEIVWSSADSNEFKLKVSKYINY